MAAGANEKTTAPQVRQEGDACQHHWVIAAPDGPVSLGKCKLCGAVKEFQNYVEGAAWAQDVSLEQLAGGQRAPSDVLSIAPERPWLEEE